MKKYLFRGKVITLPMTYIDNGKLIHTNDPAWIYKHGGTDYEEPASDPDIQRVRHDKLMAIADYDNSPAVNSFTIDGRQLWVDKATRVGLVNAARSAQYVGKDLITVGLDDVTYTLSPERLIQLLSVIELYALDCYNVTLAHRVAVQNLPTVADIDAYDHTKGYPEHLSFTLKY